MSSLSEIKHDAAQYDVRGDARIELTIRFRADDVISTEADSLGAEKPALAPTARVLPIESFEPFPGRQGANNAIRYPIIATSTDQNDPSQSESTDSGGNLPSQLPMDPEITADGPSSLERDGQIESGDGGCPGCRPFLRPTDSDLPYLASQPNNVGVLPRQAFSTPTPIQQISEAWQRTHRVLGTRPFVPNPNSINGAPISRYKLQDYQMQLQILEQHQQLLASGQGRSAPSVAPTIWHNPHGGHTTFAGFSLSQHPMAHAKHTPLIPSFQLADSIPECVQPSTNLPGTACTSDGSGQSQLERQMHQLEAMNAARLKARYDLEKAMIAQQPRPPPSYVHFPDASRLAVTTTAWAVCPVHPPSNAQDFHLSPAANGRQSTGLTSHAEGSEREFVSPGETEDRAMADYPRDE